MIKNCKKPKLLIFGTSLTAHTIFTQVRDYNLFDLLGFVVDRKYKTTELFCGYPVFEYENMPSFFDKEKDYIFVAIEWDKMNSIRKQIYERIKKDGFRLANIISPNAIIHGIINGDNIWICDGVIIDNDSIINNDVFIRTRATIGHDNEVLSHSYIGMGALTAGRVVIGESSYIGVNATVFNRVHIGQKCLVGACTYVKRHLPNYSGIKTRNDGFILNQYDEATIETKLIAGKEIR